ncbi:hypothetical protein GP486_002877 [Trichoglossum hirsutum]|uniref:Uncharacterized protein n=1 Tax=Trichoglossum hirsutum TaxID=265104 RepID=A0A9P8LE49_9PEZI|nr:hypothetical protein GP486_002877 [Trichoglossum hirsutum]
MERAYQAYPCQPRDRYPPDSKVEFYKRGILGFRKHTVTPMRLLEGISMDSETEHHQVFNIAHAYSTPYFRFDVRMDSKAWGSQSRSKIGNATFQRLQDVTEAYLLKEEVLQSLRACAELLVHRRQLRETDISAWQKFTTAKSAPASK